MKGKLNTKTSVFIVCVVVLLALCITPVFSAAIPIVNYSFEDPAIGVGPGWGYVGPGQAWTQSVGIPGWICSNDFYSGVITGFGTATHGANAAWVQDANDISQLLSATLQPNYIYTLSVSLGHRSGFTLGPQIQLLAGANTLINNIPAIPADGATSNIILTYTTGSVVSPGQALTIRLMNDSLQGVQTHYDKVMLDGSPLNPIGSVPEPTTLILFGISGIAAALLKRKRSI
jgi:hypothetical protein